MNMTLDPKTGTWKIKSTEPAQSTCDIHVLEEKPVAIAKKNHARLFTLVRAEDVSGTSGLGVVAEGVEFSDGTCTLHWLSQFHSIETCANMRVVELIHGHEGRTKVVYG